MPDAVRRLAALGVAVTEDAKRLAARLRLSNAEARRLDSMGHRWWRLGGMDEARARQRLYRLGEDDYRDRMMLAWARAGRDAASPHWRELASLPQRWRAPKFPLKAADFIARGSVRWRSWVKAGSVSMSTRRGIFVSHSRSGLTAETFRQTSALRQSSTALGPAGPCHVLVCAS